MKVLVTGATGFVGREIVRQLHAAGQSIRILARSPHSPRVQEAVSRWGAEVHPGDVLEAASLDGALRGIDAVIHLVGIISEVGESTFENVHTRGTGNLRRRGAAGRRQAICPHERAGHPAQCGLALSPDQMGRRRAGSAQRAGFHDLPALAHLRAGGSVHQPVCEDHPPLAGRAAVGQPAREISACPGGGGRRCFRTVAGRTEGCRPDL